MAKKLFELIAVENQLRTQATSTRHDLKGTFEKKRHLFEEKHVTFIPNEEGRAPVIEAQSDIQTNVPKELQWGAKLWAKALDTSYYIAEGNMQARADVVLDNGDILLTQVPATALMELEKRAMELQDLLTAVPTLDPAKGFREDPDKGKHIFVAREVKKIRTHKIQKPIVLYPATTEHPAQTQLISQDEPIGTISELEWSGLITPSKKSEYLARVEELRRAIKAALHRANTVEVPTTTTIGDKLFQFVLGAE